MKVGYYTHRYEGNGDEPCCARGTVRDAAAARPGYYIADGVRVSDSPCSLPRVLHEQGPLAHHGGPPRLVKVEEADLRRARRPDASIGRRILPGGPDAPHMPRRSRGQSRNGPEGGLATQPDDVRVVVPMAVLETLRHRGGTELVTDHARRLLRTNSEHPWPLLVVGERGSTVELAQPREALQLLRSRPAQRARLTAARRSVAERITAALARAAQTEDLESRTPIVTDAVTAAVARLDTAETRTLQPERRPRPRGSVQVVTGGLPTLRPRR